MRHTEHYCHFGCKTTMTIIIAPAECLLNQGYYILIWHTFVSLRLSRRELADEVLRLSAPDLAAEMALAGWAFVTQGSRTTDRLLEIAQDLLDMPDISDETT